MSQVTDGDQVKKKKGKRDSLMLFRPLVRCVGRPFCCPRRGESVCAVTVSKNGGARFLPGEGRKGERRNSRTKVETSRPTRGKDAREILLHPPSLSTRARIRNPIQSNFSQINKRVEEDRERSRCLLFGPPCIYPLRLIHLSSNYTRDTRTVNTRVHVPGVPIRKV